MANFCHECGTASKGHSHSGSIATDTVPEKKAKVPRKASAYSKRYGKHFKTVAPKHQTKSGSWKKDGFLKTQKAAHKLAKK